MTTASNAKNNHTCSSTNNKHHHGSCCSSNKEATHVCCKSKEGASLEHTCCSSKAESHINTTSEIQESSNDDEDPPSCPKEPHNHNTIAGQAQDKTCSAISDTEEHTSCSKEPHGHTSVSPLQAFYTASPYSTLFFCGTIILLLYIYSGSIAEYFIYTLANFSNKGVAGQALVFFLAEVPRILALTTLFMFPLAFARSYINAKKARALLTTKYTILGNILASALGAVAPFCSCSAIPLFIVFITSGIPLGITLSFLLAAPLIHEVAVVLSLSLLGVNITILYVALGMVISVTVGYIMGKLHLDKYIEDWVHTAIATQEEEANTTSLSIRDRAIFSITETIDILKNIYLYVLIGLAVGACIRFAFDANGLAPYLGKDVWYSVPLAVLAGVPMYAGAPTMVPIIQTLLEKGVGIGTALVFMMSTTALSLPSAILLRRVFKMKLLVIFFTIVIISFILIGYILNYAM